MAINLGRPAYDAIQRLKGNSDWRTFVASLEEQLTMLANLALEVPVENRVDNTGYARGIRDILTHIMLVEQPSPGSARLPRPTIKAKDTAQLSV